MEIMDSIVIITYPISDDKDRIFATSNCDPMLVREIRDYKDKLAKDKIETFMHLDNIIVTEKGYYCAIWESSLKKTRSSN
jgi:hypothetical protein